MHRPPQELFALRETLSDNLPVSSQAIACLSLSAGPPRNWTTGSYGSPMLRSVGPAPSALDALTLSRHGET